MSSTVVISVENLGKRYHLNHAGGQREHYTALRDVIAKKAKSMFARRHPSNLRPKIFPSSESNDLQSNEHIMRNARPACEEFWALRNISFDIHHGDVIGVIGHNGAGKSTLFKLLSRITDPTEGKIRLKGRIASLLEVGTGFHPELTGRENIYLNGSILGMSRKEISEKFDEITTFAGVDRFLDTPVKRYSSGMYVRLAFSVAAHLEQELLIVDEVLAVGDVDFQKKCFNKIHEVSTSGRTVMLVSHNISAIQRLCTSGILISQGRLACIGSCDAVINQYLGTQHRIGNDLDLSSMSRPANRSRRLLKHLRILDASGNPLVLLNVGGDLVFELTLLSARDVTNVDVIFRILGKVGERVITLQSRHQHSETLSLHSGLIVCSHMYNARLAPGVYSIEVLLMQGVETLDEVHGISFVVGATDCYGTGSVPSFKAGYILPEVTWTTKAYSAIADEAPIRPSASEY